MPPTAMDSNLDWAASHFTQIATIGNFFIILAAFIYIYKRAGSFLFARDRVWRLFGGKSDFSNSRFEKMKKDSRELEHFKFEFNIPAPTLDKAELAEKWINSNKLLVSDVALARRYIDWSDFTDIKIKTKTKKFPPKQILISLTFSIFVLLMAASFSLTASKYWFISFPHGPTFYASTDKILFSLLDTNELTAETCKYPENLTPFIDQQNFPLDRLQSLCTVFGDPTEISRIQNGIKQQRATMGLLGTYFLLISIGLARVLAKLNAAKRLHYQLNRRASLA